MTTLPGATALTRILRSASSSAQAFVQADDAVLGRHAGAAARDADHACAACKVDDRAAARGQHGRQLRLQRVKTPVRLPSIWRRHSSAGTSATASQGVATPALLTAG